MSKQDIEKRLGFAAQGVKAEMAARKKNVGHLAVTNAEYAALAASDAVNRTILGDSQYQITSEDRAIMAAAKQAAKSALARHDAWDKAWRNAPNDAARAKVEAEAEKAESGMKKYPVTRSHFARPGVKAKMAASFEDRQRAAGYKWQVRYTKQLGKTDSDNAMEIDETLAFATESAARKWADTMIKKGWYKGTSGTPEKVLTAKVVPFARPGAKAKMALTIYTVGAKNACYEALANLKALAKLASDTKSGWDFHVTVMTDHVKSAMSKLESSPAQAGEYLERAIDTLGMLRKIDPVRLNDIQKGSLKQLIGYVAKSLRDARANIKVVTTASRPGVKAKFGNDSISVNRIAKRMVSKLKKIVPNEGLEQFHKRLLARISEIVKSTDEAIRNPDDANLQWTIQELKDVIRDEAGSSGSLNRATGVWLGSRPGAKAKA